MNGKLYRILPVFLIIALCIAMNVGCQEKAGNAMKQSISYNLGAEPETIDPALNLTVDGANVILANFEGLMRLDKNNKAIPGIAESYTKDSDTKYTFKLRDAKWSDGKPVTAMDFEYAWKRVLAPETGAEYAYQLYYIKNGEAYNTKKVTADAVGVKVIDEKTLEVTLESPTAYFLELLASPTYMPVRQDIVEANPEKWTTTPSTYIGNGPFKMTAWRPKDAMEFVKNDNYYDADRIKLNKLIFRMVEEPNTYLTAWETGEIDIVENPPPTEVARLKSENKLIISPYLGTYFYTLNTNKKPLDDKRVRKALTYAIDRQSLIQNVIKNESFPATAFVPNGIPDADITRDFRDIGGAYFKPEGQVAEAQKLLAEAGYPNGEGFPALTLLYNKTSYHAPLAQAVQDMWKKNLNITVNLQVQEWKILQNNRTSGNYEIARHGWIADYMDPMTFMDLFRTDGGNNDPKYSNKAYDDLIDGAKRENDPQKRMQMLHDAENILMEDMPIIPIFFYTNPVLVKPYIKGVTKSPLGFTYFDEAYIEGK